MKKEKCPKCGWDSGDDWSQCKGSCPMPMSPHYNKSDNPMFVVNGTVNIPENTPYTVDRFRRRTYTVIKHHRMDSTPVTIATGLSLEEANRYKDSGSLQDSYEIIEE